MPEISRAIINKHKQLYPMSCIPSAVEMVLKLLGKAPLDYYEQQEAWDNRKDGNFSDYDDKEINGVRFKKEFGNARGDDFPLDELFARIDEELEAGRYVIISIKPPRSSFHMFVVFEKNDDGEYLAFSKGASDKTINCNNGIEKHIRGELKGTDILTYEIIEEEAEIPCRRLNG
ncbi:hypothetical protein J7M07_05900 [bacterium]|nr:hypothetical protein [bacterium]